MAFNVRIFGYTGIIQIQQNMVKQFNADSVFVADEPPNWSRLGVSNGAVPVNMVANTSSFAFGGTGGLPDMAKILGIEVPPGEAIRYELLLNGPLASNARTAGDLSRRLSGFDFIQWQPGATFQFVDAASFP